MIYAIVGLALSWSLGLFLGDGQIEGPLKMPLFVLTGSSMVILLLYMLFCLGHAIDMHKGTEKNLWIIGLLFASPIVVPYFYFKFVSKRKRPAQPESSDPEISRRS